MPTSKWAKIFGTLKNPRRLAIINALEGGEKSVLELSTALGVAQTAMSRELSILLDAELVQVRADGKFRRYSLTSGQPTAVALDVLRDRDATNGDLMYVWHVASGRQDWYGPIDRALGYAQEGAFPRTLDAWERAVHPDDYERVMAAAARHMRANEPFTQRYRVRRADGTYVTWEDCGSMMHDESGADYKWVGMVRELAISVQAH